MRHFRLFLLCILTSLVTSTTTAAAEPPPGTEPPNSLQLRYASNTLISTINWLPGYASDSCDRLLKTQTLLEAQRELFWLHKSLHVTAEPLPNLSEILSNVRELNLAHSCHSSRVIASTVALGGGHVSLLPNDTPSIQLTDLATNEVDSYFFAFLMTYLHVPADERHLLEANLPPSDLSELQRVLAMIEPVVQQYTMDLKQSTGGDHSVFPSAIPESLPELAIAFLSPQELSTFPWCYVPAPVYCETDAWEKPQAQELVVIFDTVHGAKQWLPQCLN